MSVRVAPCEWPLSYPCDEPTAEAPTGCTALDSLSAERRADLESMATSFLWNWTGQRFGLCDMTLRPCRQECPGQPTTFGHLPGRLAPGPFMPFIAQGRWYNYGCGICGDDCSCSIMSVLRLPGPVDSVTEVNIDGVVIDPGDYRIDNGQDLVRVGGVLWPQCQDLAAPSGTDGTWQVTYMRGVPVPVGGQIAAGVLACEMAKQACGDKTCALPARWQTITRQDVTIAALDTFEDVDKGHTGIWLIDSWVASIMNKPSPSVVASPDYRGRRSRRTTWGG